MQKFTTFLTKIDQFGIPFTPYVSKKERLFKTPISGLLSLIIYSLSLAYFIYVLYQWQTGHLLPTIQQENKLLFERTEQKLTQSPITLEVIGLDAANILKGKRVFDIRIIEYIGIQPFDRYRIEDQICAESPTKDALQSICLDVNNPLSNILYQDQIKGDNSLMILAYKCDPKEFSNCITDEELQMAINSQNSLFFRITQWQQQLNLNTGEISSIPLINYFMIDLNQMLFIADYLIQGNYKIDRGLLFEQIEEYSIISENKVTTQVISIKGSEKRTFHQKEAFAIIQISLSRRRIDINVQFPKLGQILAQIGGIFQILMIFQHFSLFFNQKMMDAQLIMKISKMYSNQKLIISLKESFKYLIGINIPQKTQYIDEKLIDKLNILSILQSVAFAQFILTQIVSSKELQKFQIQFLAQKSEKDQQIENLEDKNELLVDNQLANTNIFNFPQDSKKYLKNVKVFQITNLVS